MGLWGPWWTPFTRRYHKRGMNTAVQAVVGKLLVVATLPGLVKAQVKAEEPIKTTLCEMVKTPEQFNGKVVQFRAKYLSKFQWTGFVDESCSAKLQVGAYHPLDDLRPEQGQYAFTTTADDNMHPERLAWKAIETPRPVHLKQDGHYRAFRKYADTKFRWPDGGICRDCPLYQLTITATGRFDHFETQTVAVRANPATKPFIHSAGESNAPLSRFVLETVSDVSAGPIDPSIYSTGKRRNVSLEEANELVYAYLKSVGCAVQTCGLEPYHDPYFPQFISFQAIRDNPGGSGNMGFYAVDPQTGDVSDGVICATYTSPSLVRLQEAIRARIGLTDAQYRKVQTPGPMCDPGEQPRIVR